jgi:SNF2 family DNA or RNA helicase
VAQAYFQRDNLAIWSTGLGKTHLAMALAALLTEDKLIEHVIVVCEKNKVTEWLGDFRVFCRFESSAIYLGSGREKHLVDMPKVLISTYETIRNDAAQKVPGRPRALQSGPFTEALKGKRVLIVYDEASKLKNRDSGLYKHHEHMLTHARRKGDVRVIALTATPLESSPENVFNIGRLVSPGFMTVDRFEREHVLGRDEYGRAFGFVNIGEGDRQFPDVSTLYEKLAHIIQIKDKADPDVVNEFPRQVETFEMVDIPPALRKVLDEIAEIDKRTFGGPMTLRQAIGHPLAIVGSSSDTAQFIVAKHGISGLAKLPTPKLDALLAKLNQLVHEEGRKVVVFTFFGQSVLPLLYNALISVKPMPFRVATNHGKMSSAQQTEQREWFRRGDAQVYLSSDAGSRGVNLPEATVAINYDVPWLHSTYEQRINRIHRIDSDAESVLAHTLIARDTIEESMVQIMLERNAWFDTFVRTTTAGGTSLHKPSAEERRLLLRLAQEEGTTHG